MSYFMIEVEVVKETLLSSNERDRYSLPSWHPHAASIIVEYMCLTFIQAHIIRKTPLEE